MKILKTQNKLEIIGHADTPNECARISGVVHMAQKMPGVKASVRDGYASFESADEGILNNIVAAIEQDTTEFAADVVLLTLTKFVAPSEYTLKYCTGDSSSISDITSYPFTFYRVNSIGFALYKNGICTSSENLHIISPTPNLVRGSWSTIYDQPDYVYYGISFDIENGAAREFYLRMNPDITIGNTTFKNVGGVEYNGTAYETVQVDGNTYNF